MKVKNNQCNHTFIIWLLVAFLAGVVFVIFLFSAEARVYYNSSSADVARYVKIEEPFRDKAMDLRETDNEAIPCSQMPWYLRFFYGCP